MEKLLTTPQVASILEKSRKHVTALCTQGKLRARKIGQVWRVRPGDLNEFLSSHPYNDSEDFARLEALNGRR